MKQHHFKNLIMIVLLFCTTISAFAQENNTVKEPVFKKHEFSLSIGFFPTVGLWNNYPKNILGISEIAQFIGYHKTGIDSQNDYIDSWLIGSINFRYLHNISEKTSFGVSLSYSKRKATVGFNQNEYGLTFNDNYISLNFTLKWNLYKVKKCSLYTSISPGITIGFSQRYSKSISGDQDLSKTWLVPNVHITFIGIQLDLQNPIYFEVGVGNQGLFKIGVNF